MKRSTIQLSNNTLVISLPAKWVKEYSIKKGQDLDVEQEGPIIKIAASISLDQKTSIDASILNERALRWVLSSLHKLGLSEIILKNASKETFKIAEELIKDLFTGFAIVSQTSSECIIKSISIESEGEYDNILRRAFLVTINHGESIVQALKDKDLDSLHHLAVLEKTNNQLTNFCERILNTHGFKDAKKTTFAYIICWNLEKIGDEYKDLCNSLQNPPKTDSILLLENATSLLRKFYEIYYKFDLKRMTELAIERAKLEKECFELLQKAKQDSIVVFHAWNIVRKVADFSASTVALNIKG